MAGVVHPSAGHPGKEAIVLPSANPGRALGAQSPVDALAKPGALNADQKHLPQLLRDLLAKLPPETAESK
jgi:hypothetical protein